MKHEIIFNLNQQVTNIIKSLQSRPIEVAMYVTGRFIGLLYIDVVLMFNVIFLLTNEEHWFVSTLINSTALSSEIHSVKCIQMKIKLLSNMHFPNHFFLKPTTSTKDLSNLRENLATCVQYLRIFIQRFK